MGIDIIAWTKRQAELTEALKKAAIDLFQHLPETEGFCVRLDETRPIFIVVGEAETIHCFTERLPVQRVASPLSLISQ